MYRNFKHVKLAFYIFIIALGNIYPNKGYSAGGDGAWWTVVLGGPSQSASSAHAACAIQKNSYAPTSPAQFPTTLDPAGPRGLLSAVTASCSWSNHANGGPYSGPLPAWVTFECDNTGVPSSETYYSVWPGRCVQDRSELRESRACDAGKNTPNPIAGNPVILATGAKVQKFTDFETADGKLVVERHYRNPTGENPTVAHNLPAGLSQNWRFGFAEELHIDQRQFIGNLTNFVSLHRPDGTSHNFRRQSSGVFNSFGSDDEVYDLELEFVGIWPTGDPVLAATNWKVTEHTTGRVIEFQSYQRPNHVSSTPLFDIARPTKITEPGGYELTYTYAAHGVLTKIEDNFGRSLDFTWENSEYFNGTTTNDFDNSLVSRIDLPDGTYISLVYDQSAAISNSDQRLEKVEHYDAQGALLTSETYHYDTTNVQANAARRYWLTGITDAKGVRYATWAYDNLGRVISSKHGVDQDEYTFSYTSQRDPVRVKWTSTTTVTNPLGKETVYEFETEFGRQRLLAVDGKASANCVASNSSYTYGADKLLASHTDEEGNVTQYTRNTRGLVTTLVEAHGTPEARTTNFQWHATLDLPTQVSTANLTIDNTYSTAGLLTSRTETDTTSHSVPYSTNGQTRTWDYTYSSAGKLLTVDGPLAGTSDTTTFTYDANGYLATVTDANSIVTTVNSVNGRGLPTQVTDANGTATQLTYDDLGRVTTIVINPGANQSQWTIGYDAIGQVTAITEPSGATLSMTYNDVRRLTQITNGLGETIDYTYNDAGDMTGRTIKSSTSTIVYQETRTFDELSRVLTKVGQSGATWTMAYDKNSNIVSVENPRSNTTTFAYDGLDRLISMTDAHTATANRTFTPENNVATYSDPRTITTTYVNNGFGEVIREASPDIGTVDYVRDARGLVTEKTDARGIVTQYTYDAGGRLTARTYPANSAENVAFTYDSIAGGNNGVGRLTGVTDASGSSAYTYDEQGRITADVRTIGAQTYTTQYGYYSSGQIHWILYPSGRDVNFFYNSNGDLQSVVSAKDQSSPNIDIATAIEWHPHGPIQTMLYGNGLRLWRTFDQDYRMDQQNVSDGSTTLLQNFYGYTDDLNLTNIWDGLNSSQNQSFWYTPTDRIQNADGPWGSLIFYHDDSDNRTNRILTVGGTTTSDYYGYPSASNRLTSITRNNNPHRTIVLDNSGNTVSDTETGGLAKAFTYDSRGQLKTVTVGSSLKGTYTYNYAAQLVSRTLTNTTPSGTIHYIHDIEGNVIAETDGLGNTVREYIWMPSGSGSDTEGKQAISASSLPLAVIADVDTAPKLYYVHADHLNRPIAMMDAAKVFVWRATFLPFGDVHSITGSASNDNRFPGQWFNLESGLHYNWHRHYDPSTGRYLQPDPIGMPDGPSRFAYAVNTPQRFVDPDGLRTVRVPRYGLIPPVAIPGTPENDRFVKQTLAACEAIGDWLKGLVANNDDAELTREEKKSIDTLEKRIREHEERIRDYKADPDAHDNLGKLKDAPSGEIRQKIIDGRVRRLTNEVKKFKNEIKKTKSGKTRKTRKSRK